MQNDKVNDLITDQEITFARLVLAGEMSDQQAAEAAGLKSSTAAYTKAKPRVQAWMQHHRAAMDKLILEQEAENLRRRSAIRERVLNRLWAVADLAPDQTRNSMTSQMKALAMIVAIEALIPDRRATPAQQSLAPPISAKIYQSEWLHEQNAAPPTPSTGQPPEISNAPLETPPRSPHPDPQPSQDSAPDDPTPNRPLTFAEENASPYTSFVPDTRGTFQLPRSPFTRRRR